MISIGLPVYNGGRYIQQTLESLLAQTWTDFELVISDNASLDDTQEICQRYASKDSRIKYSRQATTQSAIWNWNHVFELASGEYFMWACHDDFWGPAYLQTCMDGLKPSTSIILSGTTCACVDPDTGETMLIDPGVTTVGLKPAARFRYYKRSLHGGRNVHGILFGIYRREVLAKAMPLRNVLAMDQVLLAELSLLGEFTASDKTLMTKRWGGASLSFKKGAKTINVTNFFCIHAPYVVREAIFQELIFKTGQLSLPGKIGLSLWSLANYAVLFLRFRYRNVRDGIKSILNIKPCLIN